MFDTRMWLDILEEASRTPGITMSLEVVIFFVVLGDLRDGQSGSKLCPCLQTAVKFRYGCIGYR